MRKILQMALVLTVFFGFSAISVASASVASAQTEGGECFLTVSISDMRPAVFMPRDIGTVTVRLKNAGSGGSVSIKSVNLFGRQVEVLSRPYQNIGILAPGEQMDITFTVKAPFRDGIYYPKVLVETESGETFRYSFPLHVDSAEVSISVESVPEKIIRGKRARLQIAVGNERSNSVSSVKINAKVERGGGEVVPSEIFIGSLAPDERKVVSLNFTPFENGTHTLVLTLTFKNGENPHSSSITVNLNATDKIKRPEIFISGIEYTYDEEINAYKITGDISNVGLSKANGVVVRVGEGEGFKGVYPYPSYFVGSLNPDDFSSFELNVRISNAQLATTDNTASNIANNTANTTTNIAKEVSIPIVIEFKDNDGNVFKKTEHVQIEISISGHKSSASSAEISPVLLIVLSLLIIVVLVAIIRSWRS